MSLVLFALAQAPSLVYSLIAIVPLGFVALILYKVRQDNRRTLADLSVTAFFRTISAATLRWTVLIVPLLLGAALIFLFDRALTYVVDGSHDALLNWVNGLRHDYAVRFAWWPGFLGGNAAAGLINKPLTLINQGVEALPRIVQPLFELVYLIVWSIGVLGWVGWGCIALRSFLDVLARLIMTRGTPPLRVDFKMGLFR